MSAPNIVNITSMIGKVVYAALANTDLTAIVNNPADSGKVLKVVTLIVTNVDGTNACDVTVSVCSQDDVGGTEYRLASTISIPANSSLIIISKDTPIYLEEDKSIGVKAGAGGDLEVVASYEEIS